MSSVDELGDLGGHVLRKTHTLPLRREMKEFLKEHPAPNLKELRGEVGGGRPLSEFVKEEREERF